MKSATYDKKYRVTRATPTLKFLSSCRQKVIDPFFCCLSEGARYATGAEGSYSRSCRILLTEFHPLYVILL